MKLITQNGPMDLPKDFRLRMERRNPLLSDEGDCTIPATLPSSSRNLASIDHRERIDRRNRYTNKIDAILQVGPIQKRGQLVLDTVHRRDGIDASFAIDSSDLYIKAKEKSLKAIFKEKDTEGVSKMTFESVAAAMTVMQQCYDNNDSYDFTVFPVGVAPYEIENQGVKETVYQLNNEVNASQELVYESRVVHEGDVMMTVPLGYGIAPFLKLFALLDRLFECLGYTVTENCFDDRDEDGILANIVVLHNCSDALVRNVLLYEDLVPSCNLSEFLDWLLAKFHAQPVVNSETKEAKIVLMEDMLTAQPDLDIGPLVEGDWNVRLNTSKRIVLTPTNSLEGTQPAYESFDELIDKYGGYLEADEIQYEGKQLVDCLILRKATGQFYVMNRNLNTGLPEQELLGTNHFVYDRKNSSDAESYSQTDVMPLMIVDYNLKKATYPYIGARLHFHTSYENKKEDDKQEIIIAQKAFDRHFVFQTTGTTQKYIPYTTSYDGENELELPFGLTNFDLYPVFWEKYNTLLLNNTTLLNGRVKYSLGQFLNLDLSRPKLCLGQRLIPVSASADLTDRFGLTEVEMMLSKVFDDAVQDSPIGPSQDSGLEWRIFDNASALAQSLFDALYPSLGPSQMIAVEDWDATLDSYDVTISGATPYAGMPLYEGQVISLSVLATITLYYTVVLYYSGGSTSSQSGNEAYQNQLVSYTFTAVYP